MRLGQLVDPIAQQLLELQKVSATQWLLRGLGAAATLLALMAALGSMALFGHIGAVLITLLVAVGLLASFRNPDSDVGLMAPAAIVVSFLGDGEISMLRAAAVGGALLIGHSAFALAATMPVHGELDRTGWRLAGSALLPVLGMSIVAGALVAGLSLVHLGPWTLVLGVIAAIGLFLTALPRER